MKKSIIFLFLIGIFITPGVLNAQEKKNVERPKNVGVSDFDSFKNSSFDIKDESATLKKNITHLDNEIKKYSGLINTIGVAKLKNDLKALRESSQAIKKLTEAIAKLDDQGKSMVENAKTIKPKTKSLGAVKNTNKSIKGLDFAKADLKSVTGLLENDLKVIIDELKKRGEPID